MLSRIRACNLGRVLLSFLMAATLVLNLASCGDRAATSQISGTAQGSLAQIAGSISEVAPPDVIQQLRLSLDAYQPQVTIVSPKLDEVLQDTTVAVKLQVRDLPIFKNADLGMGSHLQVILDNQPYRSVYDLDKPLVFEDLAPGTHLLRVFASRPWDESFKNEGAYAQTTFHIFTKTTDNTPNSSQPLLTYNYPQGSYGAEPIMLDFYLTNTPLRLAAQENSNDDIADWRIRVTANGQSFVLDKWQPIYITGFKLGKNWVRLEFLDKLGNPVKNVFNDTIRVITYEPNGKDTLSQLARGELSAIEARGIVDPHYRSKPPAPAVKQTPRVAPIPTPIVTPSSAPVPTPAPLVEQTPPESATSEEEQTQTSEPVPTESKQTEKSKSGSFFSRFRRPAASPTPLPALPEVIETPTPAPSLIPAPAVEQTPEPKAAPTEINQSSKSKTDGFFSRFRHPSATPSLPPTLPEMVETPTPEPEALVTPSEQTPPKEESTSSAKEVQELPNKEIAAPKPTSSRTFRIIQAPVQPEVPNRFIQKFAPATPIPNTSPPSKASADSDISSSIEEETATTP